MRKGSIEVENVGKRFLLGGGARPTDLRELFYERFRPQKRDPGPGERQEFWALDDVSFSVEPGEMLGIIGHNGSGKSTMLKMLTGILQPTRGRVAVHGRIGALIEVGAGFHPDLSGRENVFLNASILGLSRREVLNRFDSIVQFAELEKFIDTPVKRYSSGMYMRLGFAVAVNVNPDVLLIDEVLAVGDIAFQAKCMDRIREINAEGATVVFVSHNMGAVAKLCPRAVLLEAGKVRSQGPTEIVVNAHERHQNERIEAGYRAHDEADAAAAQAKQAETAATEAAPPPLRITQVDLLDAAGKTSRSFRTGDTLTIRLTYAADRAIRDAVVGVGINRVDGIVCYGPNTGVDRIPLEIPAGAGCIEVSFPDLALLADSYHIAVATLEGDLLLEYKEHLCRFLIHDDQGDRGVARLPHTWRLRAGAEIEAEAVAG